jgi:RHS repeat-associated protein
VTALTGTTLNSLTPTSLAQYNATNNRLTANSYDLAGNQTQEGGSRAFTYDAEDRQLTFNGTAGQYIYDGDGRRVKKVDGSGTTVFVYDAMGQLVAEYTSGAASGSSTSYITADHLGSTRAVTRGDGSVKAMYDYLPFGEELGAGIGQRTGPMGYGGADTTKQKFTGKERDTETGLDYFGARYYSSAQGRFTSADPVIMTKDRLADPQQINLYAYTRNDPLNLLDPTGAVIAFEKDKRGNLTKSGKEAQELYKKYVDFLNKDPKKYASQLATVDKLNKSDVTYLIQVTSNEFGGSHEGDIE